MQREGEDQNNEEIGYKEDPVSTGGPTNEQANMKRGDQVFREKIINDPLLTGGPTNQQATAKSDSSSDDQEPNYFPVL